MAQLKFKYWGATIMNFAQSRGGLCLNMIIIFINTYNPKLLNYPEDARHVQTYVADVATIFLSPILSHFPNSTSKMYTYQKMHK